ncbi:MAG: aminotransferase class I/II-fold pyridoxal phosphate-dependent enzyme [Candidatus Aureabacteria bacterium]|nr:aminotransferase class I/II-fold pyridoxal phosphate-dependent enzyme [Candidatus Auribacterota bacterium]
MVKKISDKVQFLKPSGIREFFDLVIGMDDVISLGVGEPDFTTPWNIIESAIYSFENGYTSYTSNKGLFELRNEISKNIKKRYGIHYNPETEILITVGVSEANDLAMRALLNKGDEVIIHEPCYVAYEPLITLSDGKAVIIRTSPANGFKLSPGDIKKVLSKKTKAILFNYPCNPTGASYTKKELSAITNALKDRDIIVMSDEIYGDLTYDFEHTPIITLPGMKEKTLYLNGFSKAYAMTGWRIGYACGPEWLIAAMNKVHQYTMLCAPITGQIAAIEALKRSYNSVLEMKNEYRRRRNLFISGLNEIGLEAHMPEGAFYSFASIKKTNMDSKTFAKKLLHSEKVAVVPGTAFGEGYDDFIRMCYATSTDKLKEALLRIGRFIKRAGK